MAVANHLDERENTTSDVQADLDQAEGRPAITKQDLDNSTLNNVAAKTLVSET
jgi:hypothetical protein